MDLNSLIKEANPNIVLFLLTTGVAIVSWIIKSLVDKPLIQSKETFNTFFPKRLEILMEVKTRLNFIAYFPNGKENLDYKEQLQAILLRDGRAGYLSKEIFDNVLKISIEKKNDETILLDTVSKIDEELYALISKIKEETNFYRRFSNLDPFKRFLSITLLFVQYAASLFLVISIFYVLVIGAIYGNVFIKFAVIFFSFLGIIIINKWLGK